MVRTNYVHIDDVDKHIIKIVSDRNWSHGNRSHGNRSHGNRSHGNRSHGNRSHGNRSQGNRSQGNRSQGKFLMCKHRGVCLTIHYKKKIKHF